MIRGWWVVVDNSDGHESSKWWRTTIPFLSFLSFSVLFYLLFVCLRVMLIELKWEGISWHSSKTSGEQLSRDTATYDDISSPRTTDEVTYGIIKSLSKAIKITHISQHYLPHVRRGTPLTMQCNLASSYGCHNILNVHHSSMRSKQRQQKVDLSRCIAYDVGSYSSNNDAYMHGIVKRLHYYLN